MPNSVLKEWVFELPYRMQSVMMSALRGCDTARKDDASKYITRGLRGVLLNNADPTNTFIVGDGVPDAVHVKAFLWDLDAYPLHFVMHTTHAAEIVGYKHPDDRMRIFWSQLYRDLVKALHLNPETEAQLDVRLGPTEAAGDAPAPKHEMTLEEGWAALGHAKRGEKPAKEPAPKEPKEPKKWEPGTKWDAGTGTSHGGRSRAWSGGS